MILVLLVALLALGLKSWLIAQRAQALYADARALATTVEPGLDANAIVEAGPLLSRLRADAAALREEAGPLLPVGPLLAWVPTYGPAIAAAGPLLDAAVELSAAADDGYAGLAPLLSGNKTGQPLGRAIVAQLSAEQPRLMRSRAAAARALELWPQLPIDALPAGLQPQLARLGTFLPEMIEGLDLAIAAPQLLGSAGPREYLIYAQNPDELRPTGGFISAAGTVTLSGGVFADVTLSDTSQLDDPTQYAYPDPPAALRRYMGIDQWLLRDSNWSPDFPTAARTGMELYEHMRGEPVGGVVALNPAALRLILGAIGPLSVEGTTVSADTLISYIRQGYDGEQGDGAQPWVVGRKSFLGPLATAIVARLEGPAGVDLPSLANAIEQALDARHMQVVLREPAAARLLARRGWDGALRVGHQDFLMVADANLGYNKVNPNIRQAITYTVDLSDLGAPLADLRVSYTHVLQDAAPCDQKRGFEVAAQIARYEDWMTGCYWNYSRVLSPRGARLIGGAAEPTPGTWMVTGEDVPGTPATLDEEAGASVMATFFVVPAGAQRETSLRYHLPPVTVAAPDGGWSYRLMVQKQSGSEDMPVTVRVRLPAGSALQAAFPTAELDSATGLVTLTFRLTQDQPIALTFR